MQRDKRVGGMPGFSGHGFFSGLHRAGNVALRFILYRGAIDCCSMVSFPFLFLWPLGI